MVEIPKVMIVEKIRSRSGHEKAEQADTELPDKLDTDTTANSSRSSTSTPRN